MKRPPRLPYCGTCKTLGAFYGQRTRFLLNHDTVFLAELLLEYGDGQDWALAYRSFNCLSLPPESEVPVALDFAAAATVVLAHFRIEDHRVDSGGRRWSMISRLLSPSFQRAVSRLRGWDFPVEKLVKALSTQAEREDCPRSLAHVAEPTAVATALFFEHGARAIQRPDLAEEMYRAGHRFGFLIYVLDAFEDRSRDEKTGDFNPLVKWPGIDGCGEILAATADLEMQLPAALAARLRANVEERLGMRPRVLNHGCRKTIRERWHDAVALARSLRRQEGWVVFAAGCVAAFLVPHQMKSAESLHHGLGLGLNLMALGAVFSSAAPPPPPANGYQPRVAVPPGRSGNSCGQCMNCCCAEECCGECCADGCCEACGSVGQCCS